MSLTPVELPVADRAEAEHDYVWTLNFGPQHPATHTTLRIVLKLDGERVVDAVPEIGYLHSGFEKIGEHLDYNQYVTVTDRMNYISPMANNVAWHHAVENLLETPPGQDGGALSRTAIRSHIRASVDHLRCSSSVLGRFIAEDGLVVVGAEYSLESGVVDFFEEIPNGANSV